MIRSIKSSIAFCILVLLLATTLSACGSKASTQESGSNGQEQDTSFVCSLGSVAAETSVQIEAAKMFADKVKEYTNDTITINVFPASQLGSDESMCEDLSRGTLEFAFLNQGSCAGFDQMLDCHYLPYIARNYDEADELFYGDGIIPKTLTETLNSNGIQVVGWYENEFRGVSSNNKILTVDDFKGLKMRVPGSVALKDYFTQMGAQCVTLTMGELYTALQQKTCDGQDNGVLITYDNMLHEVNNHYTYTRHVYAMSAMAVSDVIWKQFSSEQQEAILKAAAEVQEWEIQATRDQVEERLVDMSDSGVEVHQLTDEDMDNFTAVADTVWENMRSVYGDAYIDALKAEVTNVRNK